jgi:hypothetical protein
VWVGSPARLLRQSPNVEPSIEPSSPEADERLA